MPDHLFAYGTLRPGLAPPAVRAAVDHLAPLGSGSTPGTLFDLGGYPGATFGTSGTVHGMVLRLPVDAAAVLAALDAYEGVPDLYVRVPVPVTRTDAGDPLTCWAYQYNRDLTGRPPIPSGVYERRP